MSASPMDNMLPPNVDGAVPVTRESLSALVATFPEDRIRHVYPTFGREHITDKREQCWCQPKIDIVETGDGAVIIHEVGH